MPKRWVAPALAGVIALSTAGCAAVAGLFAGVPDQPQYEKAIPPIVLVAQGTSAGGDYRAWVYRTSDGMTCLETALKQGGGRSCVGGQGWDSGPGISVGDSGVFVNGSTTQATATSAVVHAASSGVSVTVPLADAAPVLPGVRFFVAGFAPGSDPTTVDVVDASGAVLESLTVP